MNKFSKHLESKLKALKAERADHEKAIQTIDAKLEVLDQLFAEDAQAIEGKLALLNEIFGTAADAEVSAPPRKRGPGRPRGAKSKKGPKKKGTHALNDDLYQEAVSQLESTIGSSDAELQKRRTSQFNPQPRPTRELGPGIVAGTKKHVESAAGQKESNTTISIEDDQ